MRCLAVAAAFLIVVTVPLGTPAYAAPKAKQQGTRYCAMYRGGGENCGFSSLEQCRQSVAGNGGVCMVAPMQDMRAKNPAPFKGLTPREEDDTRVAAFAGTYEKARRRRRAFPF
jgi:Protein of unknown function (DUF3551)